ncbi:GvpL/GvpF family gas vesicle protein [Streptomyces oceani]|uniref:Gas vesicle protein n=1 Tax=Streptomyces oceani TaxID=1075402 RepID=A0A1E7KP77_9ACTN|nr:GvpL/GvpF family gas vesicle protein [Streptomyces oceani]OEV05779.1 hypothetical protein AN216_02240 [Streptomyces oceani]
MNGVLCYVYAVGDQDAPLAGVPARVEGLDGSALRTVSAAGLSALVSSVAEERYDETGLAAQLEDLARVEVVARRHHAVVEAAYQHAYVLPMRLATLCRDDDRVAGMLDERGAEFRALLNRLTGRAEWGVKVYADPSAAEEPAPATPARAGREPPDPRPGRAYLRQRRTQRDGRREARRAAESVALRVSDTAAALAVAGMAHRPQQGELATGPGENIANDAYLVETERAGDFAAKLHRLAEESPGVRIEVTGPWAPYSFATPSDA